MKIRNAVKVLAAFLLAVMVLMLIGALCGCRSSKGVAVETVHKERAAVAVRDSVAAVKAVERVDSVASLVVVERKDCVVICVDTLGRVIHRSAWHDVSRSNDVSSVRNVSAKNITSSFAHFDSVAARVDSSGCVVPEPTERKLTAWETSWRWLSDAATAVVVSLIVVTAVRKVIYLKSKVNSDNNKNNND